MNPELKAVISEVSKAMKILITGAKGFVGKNLSAALRNIQEGKDRTRSNLHIEAIYEYDLDSNPDDLDVWCKECDFVFNLAGVNRPKDTAEFMKGNFGFASTLLNILKRHKNTCPVMLSSSIQAILSNSYGLSKKAGEDLFFRYAKETGAKVLVYRFPNVFGKWCRPNYNSAVATFCHAIANDLPYTINDPEVMMHLIYIDDVVGELLDALEGKEHREGRYCQVPIVHDIKLGEIVELLKTFAEQSKTLLMPEMPEGSFAKKLYSTYLSYLPKEKAAFDLRMNVDERGSFTELIHTLNCGQVSVNISKPGITKGQHWHNTKWEQFIVVSGHGLICQRSLNDPEGKVLEWKVSGDHIQAVHMLPGYTHSIVNLSETEDLVTVMYCNEVFNPEKPDTYFEPV